MTQKIDNLNDVVRKNYCNLAGSAVQYGCRMSVDTPNVAPCVFCGCHVLERDGFFPQCYTSRRGPGK